MTFRTAESSRYVTLNQISMELNRTTHQTRKILSSCGFIGIESVIFGKKVRKYDPRALEVVKGLYGIPHRNVLEQVDDWLSRHVSGAEDTINKELTDE